MSEEKDTRVEEGRNAHGTIALPEQKAFFLITRRGSGL